jgi:hypothetical protein
MTQLTGRGIQLVISKGIILPKTSGNHPRVLLNYYFFLPSSTVVASPRYFPIVAPPSPTWVIAPCTRSSDLGALKPSLTQAFNVSAVGITDEPKQPRDQVHLFVWNI